MAKTYEIWQFKPGNPGGPGRPKGSISLTTRLKQALAATKVCGKDVPEGMDVAQALIESAIVHAIKGNPSFFHAILERVDGKMPDATPDITDMAEIVTKAKAKADGRKRNRGTDGPAR